MATFEAAHWDSHGMWQLGWTCFQLPYLVGCGAHSLGNACDFITLPAVSLWLGAQSAECRSGKSFGKGPCYILLPCVLLNLRKFFMLSPVCGRAGVRTPARNSPLVKCYWAGFLCDLCRCHFTRAVCGMARGFSFGWRPFIRVCDADPRAATYW